MINSVRISGGRDEKVDHRRRRDSGRTSPGAGVLEESVTLLRNRSQAEGKNGTQHPFPLSNLKDGDRVRLGTNEMGPDIKVDVSYDESDGYPSITIEESEADNPRSLSVEGSVQHPLELSEVDSKGNSRSIRCQPPAR